MVPAFFMTFMTSPDLQTITRTVAAVRPDVEIWDVQVVKGENLVRVLIEHPDGVDADLCAEVANVLSDVRDHGGLEVSSPGIERPLIRTTHYERALGETVQIRLKKPREGRRNLRGRLTAADDTSLRLELDDGVELDVPREEVAKSNIVWNPVTP
jgi:ribosome maturation factor RimP